MFRTPIILDEAGRARHPSQGSEKEDTQLTGQNFVRNF